jgi:hypothetical protein
MTVIRHKSNENLNAGELLIRNSMLASSVHCFYYSCVQLMIHILISVFHMTEESIEDESRRAGRGFHNWLINQIYVDYIRKNRRNARSFRRKIYNLKDVRIQADYKLIEIDANKSSEAKFISERIINMLKGDYLQ